jgi:hypothetical protein
VMDCGAGSLGGAPAAIADHLVLVGASSVEPALAAVATDCLRRVGPDPIVVLNRAREAAERWSGRAAVELPDSRMGAGLALSGREPRGDLGRAIAALADLCGERPHR